MNSPVLFQNKTQTGFTLIEVLIVIAITALLALVTSPFMSRFVLQTQYNTTTDNILSSIRKAQAYAMDGKNGAVWGVCRASDNIRLYQGSCSTPVTSEDFSIPSSVTVTDLNDITVNQRGEPSSMLSISVSTSIISSSIQLNISGGTNY